MKSSFALICLLSLSLPGAEGVLAQSATPAPVSQTTPTPESDQARYIKFEAAELTLWQQRISDFNARAETTATESGQAAKLELAAAWSAVQDTSNALATAGAADWDRAKTAYESAKQALLAKWTKFDAAKT